MINRLSSARYSRLSGDVQAAVTRQPSDVARTAGCLTGCKLSVFTRMFCFCLSLEGGCAMKRFVLWPSLMVAFGLLFGGPTMGVCRLRLVWKWMRRWRRLSDPVAVVRSGRGLFEKTVMVPSWETETRTVTVTECRPETRQRTITVNKRVPETKTVERTCTVMVPETRTKQVSYCVPVPVTREVTEEYTVCVA